MKFLQAINALERKLESLRFRYPDGSPMEGIVSMGIIGRYHGRRYDHILDSLESGIISVDEYFLEFQRMIAEYQLYRINKLSERD